MLGCHPCEVAVTSSSSLFDLTTSRHTLQQSFLNQPCYRQLLLCLMHACVLPTQPCYSRVVIRTMRSSVFMYGSYSVPGPLA